MRSMSRMSRSQACNRNALTSTSPAGAFFIFCFFPGKKFNPRIMSASTNIAIEKMLSIHKIFTKIGFFYKFAASKVY
jgi:hypothetical protein